MSNFKKILLLVVILNVLIIIDVAGYMLIEGANFTDSLYMSIITITTVGYREIFELTPNGKLFTIWVIISGLGTFFLMAGRIAESAFEGNLRRVLGRRKMKGLLQLKDHIIVAGFGVMGEQVCRELARAKLKFVVIENNKERFANAEERGYEVINGNATEEEILKQSGVEKARTFISLLSSDADNVFTVLTAREMNPPAYIITRAMDAANQNKLYKIGANRVIAPYELSSRRIVNMVLKPNVVDFIDVMVFGPNMALSIEEITVHEGSPMAGKEIRDSGLRQDYNVIIIAVKRKDEMFFNPAPDHRILPGDILIMVGEREKLLNLN